MLGLEELAIKIIIFGTLIAKTCLETNYFGLNQEMSSMTLSDCTLESL